ncbi:Cytochrome P450 [Penicillium macrosclerotiorum]|uniref:Cytochrome P450 n=1 Tax=Penicillium macrosclerotiorum TaxID=303699 RepID=UPI002548F671|nr:Cytochrome P450 [Penicillium macrosclerotiorum]KAJ5682168.1 Cytochrome P450 [Penicillium macrosclerotiorum]
MAFLSTWESHWIGLLSQCLASHVYLSALAILTWSGLLLVLVHDLILCLRLPPGPTPIPFLGNKLIIPTSSPWITFEKWSQIYGPIFTIWIGRRPTIIISDPNVAVALLEKRGTNFSSRPRFVVMGELYWDNAGILVQPYGKEWQIRRRMLHQALNPSALRLYKPTQEAEATRLCSALLDEPGSYEGLIDRFTASVVFSIAYGHRIDSMSSKVVLQRLDFMQYAASLNVPGRYLAETVPLLKRIPNWLAPWKAEIQRRGRKEAETNMALLRHVEEELRQAESPSEVPDSLAKLLLQAREVDQATFGVLSKRDFSFVPASLFGAGSDTTASTLCSAILMLITNIEVQTTAQKELDYVIGRTRLPTFDDELRLPYIKALCNETLRIRPVAVLGGTPHANSVADTYNGYFIPQGTTILSNSWAINLNPTYYPNPHNFNPLRFLKVDPTTLPYLPKLNKQDLAEMSPPNLHPAKEGHSSFGWGRRICPGAGLAENSLFIAVARLLWAFEFRPVRESDGSTRKYDTFAYTQGFNIRPLAFDCDIRVRSEERRQALMMEAEIAEAWMSQFTPFED